VVTHLLETTMLGGTYEALKTELPQERTNGPRRAALLDFYLALERIARGRRGPLKPPGNGGEGDEACREG